MGRLARWLGFEAPTVLTAADSMVVLPSGSGSAQLRALSPAVGEAFGISTATDRVTRAQAMSIPAVRQGRQVIAGTIGAAPLACVRQIKDRPPERVQRTLLVQPDPNVTRAFTVTWTLDDLIFHGVAWWRVTCRGSDGKPSQAERVAPGRVAVDTSTGRVRVDGEPVEDRDMIRFDGPDEGLLVHGARTLRTALMLEEAVRNFARLDVPVGLITDEQSAMTEDEVEVFLTSWEAARAKRSTAYLPQGLRYQNPTWDAEKTQLAQARAFQAAEIARHMNLPPSAVNAPSGDSMTYATTEGNRRELVDRTFAPYIAALEGRLSMGDVTPAGTQVYVDLAQFIRGDLTGVLNAAKTAIDAGVMTVDEVRTEWLRLAPLNSTTGGNTDG